MGSLEQTETKLKGFASPTVSNEAQVSGITGWLGSQHHEPGLEVGAGGTVVSSCWTGKHLQ